MTRVGSQRHKKKLFLTALCNYRTVRMLDACDVMLKKNRTYGF